MSSPFPTKVFPSLDQYHHNSNDQERIEVITNNSSDTINMTDNSMMDQHYTNNSTSIPTTTDNNRNYYSDTTNSTASSSMVGFFLFTLGLVLCFMFLSMVAKKIHQMNSDSQHPTTATNQESTTDNNNHDPDTSNIGYKVYTTMSCKERRHYINSVLHVKENCSTNNNDNYVDVEQQQGHDVESLHDIVIDDDVIVNINDDNDSDSVSNGSTDISTYQYPSCVICFEPFHNNHNTSENDNDHDISYSMDTNCHHEYHRSCITEWLMKHPNCPYCRRLYIPLPSPEQGVVSTTTTTDIETPATSNIELSSTIPNNTVTISLPPLNDGAVQEQQVSQEQPPPQQQVSYRNRGTTILSRTRDLFNDFTNDWRHPSSSSTSTTTIPSSTTTTNQHHTTTTTITI